MFPISLDADEVATLVDSVVSMEREVIEADLYAECLPDFEPDVDAHRDNLEDSQDSLRSTDNIRHAGTKKQRPFKSER